MNTLQNRLWPNTDGNLGKIKVQIPTGTADDPWPEGDALVGNFVYKDGKLVGFIGVAALIPNESGETIIPYDTINTKFPGILKDTFIINAGERCKYQFAKLEEDIAAYTSARLFEIMDADKFKVSYNKDENKVIVSLPLDTTAARIAEVESLLERVLPSNLMTEMEWADGLPMSYTRLEYIQSVAYTNQRIDTGFYTTGQSSFETRAAFVAGNLAFAFASNIWGNSSKAIGTRIRTGDGWVYTYYGSQSTSWGNSQSIYWTPYEPIDFVLEKNKFYINGILKKTFEEEEFVSSVDLKLLGDTNKLGSVIMYSFKYREADTLMLNMIPALDPTGAPCMFDTVSRTPFYNSGTDDFLYPGKETEVATYSLRNRMYAQMTEHGVRRLYHVPKGCTMTKDEYAAENGFKELVEPPMPEEGYWASEWRETNTQIICDWIETEPPVGEIE